MLLVHSVATCSNTVDVAGSICSTCKKIPLDVTPTMRTIHGKLNEPIPDTSHIYGSKWYWDRVEKYGAVNDKWLTHAQKAQTHIEDTYSAYGVFKISVKGTSATASATASTSLSTPTPLPIISTPPKAKAKAKAKAKPSPKVESIPTSIISYIKPRESIYVESEGSIETLPTDSYTLSLDTLNGIPVFKCENGMVFSCINNEPASLLGYYKNSIFTPI